MSREARKGRIESPGYEKMRAIAKAMGFPPEAWFEESVSLEPDGPRDEGPGIAGRAEHLFDAIRNPKTGESNTNAEVGRMTLGDLPREVVEGIRTGAISDPPVSQVAALAAAFGVPPSYLLDRGKDPADFNEEVVNPSPTGSAWRAMVEWPRPSLPLPNSPEYVEGGSTRWGNAGRQ